MHDGSPARQRVPIHGVQDGLRNRLEQVLRFLGAQRIVSRRIIRECERARRTRSGSHKPSATPYSLSVAVPATAKSFGVVMHPILKRVHQYAQRELKGPLGTHVSIVEMNGFGFGFSEVASGMPATTGSIKYGPNLPHPIPHQSTAAPTPPTARALTASHTMCC